MLMKMTLLLISRRYLNMLKLQFLSVNLKPFVGNFLLDFFLILWTNGHVSKKRHGTTVAHLCDRKAVA